MSYQSFTGCRLGVHISLSLLLCAAPCVYAAHNSDIIAKVGGIDVSADDIRPAIENLDAQTQAAISREPASLEQVVRALLTQRVVLKQALAEKWDQDAIVTAALARTRDGVISQTYLQSVSKPPESYPSDEEVQAAYEANKVKLLVPRQYQLAQILVNDPKGSDSVTDAKAAAKVAAIEKALSKREADFSSIATVDSDDSQSAAKGGLLGWIAENRIQPEIRAELGSPAKGSVTKPARLDDGLHILKVLDVKEPYTPTLDEIRPQLIQQMRAERTKANSQQYIAKLLQQTPIQINELNLSHVIKQAD